MDARLQRGYFWPSELQGLRTPVVIGWDKAYPLGSRKRGIGALMLPVMDLVLGQSIKRTETWTFCFDASPFSLAGKILHVKRQWQITTSHMYYSDYSTDSLLLNKLFFH